MVFGLFFWQSPSDTIIVQLLWFSALKSNNCTGIFLDGTKYFTCILLISSAFSSKCLQLLALLYIWEYLVYNSVQLLYNSIQSHFLGQNTITSVTIQFYDIQWIYIVLFFRVYGKVQKRLFLNGSQIFVIMKRCLFVNVSESLCHTYDASQKNVPHKNVSYKNVSSFNIALRINEKISKLNQNQNQNNLFWFSQWQITNEKWQKERRKQFLLWQVTNGKWGSIWWLFWLWQMTNGEWQKEREKKSFWPWFRLWHMTNGKWQKIKKKVVFDHDSALCFQNKSEWKIT